MENLEIFSDSSNILFTVGALLLMFYACSYVSSTQPRIAGSLWLLCWGMLCSFCGSMADREVFKAYAADQDINLYVSISLLFYLGAMECMVLSALRFLIKEGPINFIIIGLGLLGLVASLLFVYLIPDGVFVNNMRAIFPLTGYVCVAIGFWTQTDSDDKQGFFCIAVVASVMSVLQLLHWLGYFQETWITSWYIPAVMYLLCAVSMMFMKIDFYKQRLEAANHEIEKFNSQIEEIIRLSPFPILITRLSDDKIILANNNAIKTFGIDPNELERYRLRDFFADSDNRRLLNERLENEREVHDFEILVKTPQSDAPFWLIISANIIDYNYNVALYSSFQDITTRKNREEMLKNQAIRDPLTTLYNRRYFEEETLKQIAKAKQARLPYTVLMLDCDFFKKVNDTYGHKIGDKVLFQLATTTQNALRDNDIVARYGGEEFVVFLPGIPADKGRIVADRLRQSIAKQVVYSDQNEPVRFTVSIGVSSSDISDNVDVLIKTADEALYRAKQNGRNRVEVFMRQDLKKNNAGGQEIHTDESKNRHPVFDKENNAEISLLDGVDGSDTTMPEHPHDLSEN